MKKLLVSLVAVITIITVKHVSANNGYDEIENAKEETLNGSNELKLKSQKKDDDDHDDFYKLKVTEPGKVKIRIDSLPLSIESYSNVDIAIVNKEQEVFSSFTLLEYDSKRDYIYSYLKKGTYYLQVSLDNIKLDEMYQISASLDLDGYYEAEFNNIPSMANNLEVNRQYEGSFLEHDLISELDELGEQYVDVDYYRFKVEKDSKIQLLTTAGSEEQLQYSLLDRSGNKILTDIRTRALKTNKSLNQGTVYLKKGEYIVGLHHEDYDLNHEVPYKLKINSTPVIYSEANGSNFLFGKTYNGSLIEANDESDLDVFSKKLTETRYIKTYTRFKSGDIT
ncbi:hypothetical protein, partial [Exiguobacterium oxidotolerans]|uniref:hypothetical protein n=1 Tax=Exiguobacterium oxidotolerans TaxID=223958 RepID=UPI001330E9E1